MRIHVQNNIAVLIEPADFTSLSVSYPPGYFPSSAAYFGAVREDHAWFNIEVLRGEVRSVCPVGAGEKSFDPMINFARTSGWLSDDETAVRAHLHSLASSSQGRDT